jgi:hypothetical protein
MLPVQTSAISLGRDFQSQLAARLALVITYQGEIWQETTGRVDQMLQGGIGSRRICQLELTDKKNI